MPVAIPAIEFDVDETRGEADDVLLEEELPELEVLLELLDELELDNFS